MNGLALFAGVGGLELGISTAFPNARAVCYVEGEAYAAAVLASQMEKGGLHEAPIWSDVTTFDGKPWRGKVDFISGGFPCQPWSKAGNLEKTNDERWLWDDIERIICETRPQFLFLENVPGLIDGGICHILKSLAEIGFNVEWGCLKASDVGANHRRDRVFIFAYCAERGCIIPNAMRKGFGFKREDVQNSCQEISSRRELEGIEPSQCCEDVPNSDLGLCTRENGQVRTRRNISSSSGSNVPHSFSERFSKNKLGSSGGKSDSIGCGEEVPDCNGSRLKKQCGEISKKQKYSPAKCGCWWQTEPPVGRVVDGMADRVDRLRACGNGVVPLQAARAFIELHRRASRRCLK